MVNCPCTVYTEERGYEWKVFRRQPDRKIGSAEEEDEDVIPVDISDDDGFFSAEAEEALLTPVSEEPETTTETAPESLRPLEKANYSSTDLSDGYKEMAKPQMTDDKITV